MVTTDQKALTSEWEGQGRREPTGGVEDIGALIHRALTEPSPAASKAAEGQPVESTELFPDDQWDDTPYLDKELWRAMVEKESPFHILGVMGRTSVNGPMFKVIVEIEDGLIFSYPFSYKPEYNSRNEKLAKVAAMLQTGAPRVGPFVFTCTDLDDPKAFQSFRSHRPKKQAGKAK